MNGPNLAYILNLKAQDVPWSRITTAYGRASRFPEIFELLGASVASGGVKEAEAKFDVKDVDDALTAIFNEIEHQGTLWHATPFALLFLARIFMQARAEADKFANKERNGGAESIAASLGEFFAFVLKICDDADKTEHAAPLANFSDILAEKYLWPQSDEDDEELWDEGFYDDEIFYSFYYYSRAVLKSTGVDFARFKSKR